MLYVSPFFTAYCIVVAVIFGACMGSFLNCWAWRILHNESVLKGRSHCDVCGHVLTFRDLVPVLSYVLSRGKCRYCGAKLSLRHVFAELITAAVFVSLLLKYGISLRLIEALVLACLLLACSFADLEGYIIPDRFIIAAIAVRCAYIIFVYPLKVCAVYLLGGFAVAGGLLILVLIAEKIMKREAMGGGDIKLLFVTGLILGWQKNILCLLFACIIGIIFGLIGNRTKDMTEKASGEDEEEEDPSHIPWGPSITAAAWLCALFGDGLISAYLGLF